MCDMVKKIIYIVFLLFFHRTYPLTVGSNMISSRMAQSTFISTDPHNEMRGFGSFENGFVLTDTMTTCSFTSFYPVSGNIMMNGGLLNMYTDLTANSQASFVTSGTINGNGYTMYLPDGVTLLPTSPTGTCLNTFASQTQLTAVNSISWSYDSKYIAAGINQGGSNNTLSIMQFNGARLVTLSVAAPSAVYSIVSISWHPFLYYLLIGMTSTGTTDIHQVIYLFDPVANTLTLTASVSTMTSITSIGWAPNGLAYAWGSTLPATVLYTFNTSTGVGTQIGVIDPTANATSPNSLSWEPNGAYYIVGYVTGGGNPELILYFYNVSASTLTQQLTYVVGNTVSAVSCAPFGGYIAVGLTGGTNNLRIFQHSISGNTLTDLTASHIGETANVLSLDWAPTGSTLVVGLNAGTGETQLRTYTFNPVTNTLGLTCQVSSAASINALNYSPAGNYLVTGDSLSNVIVYGPSSEPFVFQNIKLVLNGNVRFLSPVVFYGLCEIEGNNFEVDLSGINSFSLSTSSTLLLKNTVLTGVQGSVINTVDTTGLLQLQNSTWIQTGDFVFGNGALNIIGECLFTGSSRFVYQSTVAATIESNSTMYFDYGMTFSYDPLISSNSLISMIDQTSIMYLYTTTLSVNGSGLQLTNGTLVIDGMCPLYSSGTSQSQGVSIGNGISSANNLKLKILPESGFNITSGFLVYNNV